MISSAFASRVRLAGGLVLGLGAVLVAMRVLAGLQAGEAALPMIGSAGLIALVAIGLGMVLLALASMNADSRLPETGDELSHMDEAIAEIRDELTLLRSDLAAEQARREEVEPLGSSAEGAPADPQALVDIRRLLDEVRQLAMMNDQQRQEHFRRHREQHKLNTLRRAQEAIGKSDWAKAQQLLDHLRPEFGEDRDLKQVQDELRIARSAGEAESLSRLRSHIEDLMAISNWDEALAEAQDFAAAYPDNDAGQTMLARVTRERDLYRENTAERLYREIKRHIEQREWTRAAAEADRLIEKFGDHRRAIKIREQLEVIHENAEIQQRQEQEKRIEELLRARRLVEAIELAEDLIERYPGSPQAQSLEEMLPKLRERAIKDEIRQV